MLTPILNRFIYRPDVTSAPSDFTPANLSLTYEEVFLRTKDGVTISGWYVISPKPKGALLYLHGNGGDCRDWVQVAPRFVREGYNLFILDYRGYGKSAGKPTEKGLYLDGDVAWEWIKERSSQNGIPTFILGKSLGSGIATWLATKHSPTGLILDSAFTSMREVIAFNAKWLPPILIPKMFESLTRVEKIVCPTLVIHGDKDDLIPLSQGLRLYKRLQAPKILGIIQGAGHNDIDSFNCYYHWVIDFMNDPMTFIREMKDESETVFKSYLQKRT